MNFRALPDLFIATVLTRKREPNKPPVKFHALPRPRDYSAYEVPTYLRHRANVARMKIEGAQRAARLPAMLKRQAD